MERLPDDVLCVVFTFLKNRSTLQLVCHRFKCLIDNLNLQLPLKISTDLRFNCKWFQHIYRQRVTRFDLQCFRNLGIVHKGTEGVCFKVVMRGKIYALKKPRMSRYEGLPYYIWRELEFFDHVRKYQKRSDCCGVNNIIHYHDFSYCNKQLLVLYEFVGCTLEDVIKDGYFPEVLIMNIMHQRKYH